MKRRRWSGGMYRTRLERLQAARQEALDEARLEARREAENLPARVGTGKIK